MFTWERPGEGFRLLLARRRKKLERVGDERNVELQEALSVRIYPSDGRDFDTRAKRIDALRPFHISAVQLLRLRVEGILLYNRTPIFY
jgi:hypothetical protein